MKVKWTYRKKGYVVHEGGGQAGSGESEDRGCRKTGQRNGAATAEKQP